MRSYGGIWADVPRFGNLYSSMINAAKGARKTEEVSSFVCNAEYELLGLKERLEKGSYRPGGYRVFHIKDPKERLISAAPFRDRVVHHAVCDVLEPVLERIYTGSSYACRKNRGTHSAVARAKLLLKGNRYFLKCDIRKFFNSIDHASLKEAIAKRFRDRPLVELLGRVIDNPVPGCLPCKGVAIGNLTSQHFANLLLTELDLFVLHKLKPSGYIRYMDDFVLFHDQLNQLHGYHYEIADFLGREMKLKLKERASFSASAEHGLPFLGMRIHRNATLLNGESKLRLQRKLKRRIKEYQSGIIDEESFHRSMNSIFGHLRNADTLTLRRALLLDNGMLLDDCMA